MDKGIEKLETIFKKLLERYEIDHDESIHRDFYTDLLKELEEKVDAVH